MKIHFLDRKFVPLEGSVIGEHTWQDENELPWRILQLENGFVLKFEGDEYFSPDVFRVENQEVPVVNTRIAYFQHGSLDDYCELRDTIRSNSTDDIWAYFEKLLFKRFESDKSLLTAEQFSFKNDSRKSE